MIAKIAFVSLLIQLPNAHG